MVASNFQAPVISW